MPTAFPRLISIAALLLVSASAPGDAAAPADGDLIFHTSRSAQSLPIQLATHSRYSHMGIVFSRNRRFEVLEAVQPVKWTPLEPWIRRGAGGRYVLKRLKERGRLLTPQALSRMRRIGEGFLGRPYDLVFAWSDERLYCSELVWKIYERALGLSIGTRQRLREFDLTAPVVKTKLAERYGSRLPLDEWVISPEAMFRSDLLETVAER